MSETADFTIEVRDRDFQRVGQIAPEYTDLKFVDVHNGVGSWELKLPAEHVLLPALKEKGSGIVVTEHWVEAGVHKYRIFSGRMRSARLSQDGADPVGTWLVTGVDDNVVAAATRVYGDPASPATAQTAGYWEQSGNGETVMKLAVQLNAGSTAIPARRYPWLSIAANSLRGADVKCSSRFDVLGDLLSSLGTAAGLGWEFRQSGDGVAFDVYEPQDKTGEVRLDIRNGGLESNELGFTAPSASEVLVMGQGEGAERTILSVTSAEAAAEVAAWNLRWEVVKDQRNTDDPDELLQAGEEILAEQGSTVNSLKVVPSDTPGMALGRDWYRGDRITVVVDGQETTALVTQVAVSIGPAGVLRQATVGDPVGFSFDAKIASKVREVEKRVGQVERLVGQGVDWADVSNKPDGAFAETGDVKLTALPTARAGWLLMQGQSVSRTTYAALFAALNPVVGTATVSVASPAVVTRTAHGLSNGAAVFFTTTGALPTGLAANTTYYVTSATANTFSLSATRGGPAINTSGTQSGTHTLRFSVGGVANSTTFVVPDMRGRVPVGQDGSQEQFNALGEAGGHKDLQAHQHVLGRNDQHAYPFIWGAGGNVHFSPDIQAVAGPSGGNGAFTMQNSWDYTEVTGSGDSGNLQPYRVLNYIIKT